MQRFTLALSAILTSYVLSGQTLNWAVAMDGYNTFSTVATSTLSDLECYNNKIFATGIYQGTADFDPFGNDSTAVITSNSPVTREVYLAAYNADGQFQFVKDDATVTGATNVSQGWFLTSGLDGSPYLSGTYRVISKHDTLGNSLWGYGGGPVGASTRGLAHYDGYIYTSGLFYGTVDFDVKNGGTNLSSNTSKGNENFICIYDTSGSLINARKFGTGPTQSSRYLSISDLTPIDNANLVISGTYANGLFLELINGSSINLAGAGELISLIDTAAKTHWYKELEGNNVKTTGGHCLQDSMLYVTGQFKDSLIVDSLTLYNPNVNIAGAFIIKLNAYTGECIDGKVISSSAQLVGADVEADSIGNVFVVGYYQDETEITTLSGIDTLYDGTGATSSGLNGYVLKMDNQLNVYWAVGIPNTLSFQSTPNCVATEIELDSDLNIVIAGYLDGAADFGLQDSTFILNSSSGGNRNSAFIMSIAQCTKPESFQTISSCDSVLLPNGDFTDSSGSYVFNFPSALGCDSVHTVVVDIFQSVQDSISISGCDEVILNGTTYSSSGNYVQQLQTIGGCDSTLYVECDIQYSDSTYHIVAECDSAFVQGQYYHSDGTLNFSLINSVGCDSTVTYDVTVYDSEVISTEPSDYIWSQANDTASFGVVAVNAQSYQWASNDGTGWVNLIDAGAFQGTSTPHLRVTSFNPQQYHNYLFRCYVTSLDGCIDTTANAQMQVSVGALESFGESYSLYPNPAKGSVRVHGGIGLPYSIISTEGRIVLKGMISETELIDISHLAQGVYTILLSDYSITKLRLIKQGK